MSADAAHWDNPEEYWTNRRINIRRGALIGSPGCPCEDDKEPWQVCIVTFHDYGHGNPLLNCCLGVLPERMRGSGTIKHIKASDAVPTANQMRMNWDNQTRRMFRVRQAPQQSSPAFASQQAAELSSEDTPIDQRPFVQAAQDAQEHREMGRAISNYWMHTYVLLRPDAMLINPDGVQVFTDRNQRFRVCGIRVTMPAHADPLDNCVLSIRPLGRMYATNRFDIGAHKVVHAQNQQQALVDDGEEETVPVTEQVIDEAALLEACRLVEGYCRGIGNNMEIQFRQNEVSATPLDCPHEHFGTTLFFALRQAKRHSDGADSEIF